MDKLKKCIIVGGHDQACRILDYLFENNLCYVSLCICRKDDVGKDDLFPSLLMRARRYNIPAIQPENLNAKSVLNTVEMIDPDVILSLQNNMIFGDEWLDLMSVNLGIINIHYAPLPKYGGYWPEMWAIWNEEKKFAVTMHYVTKGLDTGPIIAQRWFDIIPNETRLSLYQKSDHECYKMLLEYLPQLLASNCKINSFPQNFDDRTYFAKSLPHEGFLDLSWETEKQIRFIRAISFPGFPGPKIKIGNQVYTILCEDIPFYTHLVSTAIRR